MRIRGRRTLRSQTDPRFWGRDNRAALDRVTPVAEMLKALEMREELFLMAQTTCLSSFFLVHWRGYHQPLIGPQALKVKQV